MYNSKCYDCHDKVAANKYSRDFKDQIIILTQNMRRVIVKTCSMIVMEKLCTPCTHSVSVVIEWCVCSSACRKEEACQVTVDRENSSSARGMHSIF